MIRMLQFVIQMKFDDQPKIECTGTLLKFFIKSLIVLFLIGKSFSVHCNSNEQSLEYFNVDLCVPD